VISVITTVITAERLLAERAKWESVFAEYPVIGIQLPQAWVKLVARDIPVRTFQELGLQAFSQEVKTFNSGIEAIGEPKWLTKNLAGKLSSSVVFAVATEKEASHCLKKGLIVAGLGVKVSRYRDYSPKTQCYKCLGFGHNPTHCTQKPACRYCGNAHYTTSHRCRTCSASAPCEHLKPKCANCKKGHLADSSECEVVRAFRPATMPTAAANTTTTTANSGSEAMDVEPTTLSDSNDREPETQ
jgi:hypothetical protein